MNELFEKLIGTKDLVTITTLIPGMELTQNVYIIRTEPYLDGVKFFTNNEGSFFLSRFTCEMVSKSEDPVFITYTLKTLKEAIVEITIAA